MILTVSKCDIGAVNLNKIQKNRLTVQLIFDDLLTLTSRWIFFFFVTIPRHFKMQLIFFARDSRI
jgi:hypothetical protein